MPSLKTFRLRIRSVQSTQKITKAMKMVAAAKLRRAQEQALAARPYAEAMDKILASLGASFKGGLGPRLLAGTGSDQTHLVVVATGDRGLCKREHRHQDGDDNERQRLRKSARTHSDSPAKNIGSPRRLLCRH